jgi:hypothetical protein
MKGIIINYPIKSTNGFNVRYIVGQYLKKQETENFWK